MNTLRKFMTTNFTTVSPNWFFRLFLRHPFNMTFSLLHFGQRIKKSSILDCPTSTWQVSTSKKSVSLLGSNFRSKVNNHNNQAPKIYKNHHILNKPHLLTKSQKASKGPNIRLNRLGSGLVVGACFLCSFFGSSLLWVVFVKFRVFCCSFSTTVSMGAAQSTRIWGTSIHATFGRNEA